MILLSKLPKVLYKPREFFEDLKGNTNAKEGLIVFVFSSIIGLIVYGSFARALNLEVIVLNFGLGNKLAPLNLVIGFFETLIGLFLIAWLSNKIAIKLGGSGNFQETFGMLGYSKFLGVIEAVAGMLMLGIVYVRTVQLATAIALAEARIEEIFSFMIRINLFFTIIFLSWFIWIQTIAISVEHEIKVWKALLAIIFSTFVSGAILYLGSYLIKMLV